MPFLSPQDILREPSRSSTDISKIEYIIRTQRAGLMYHKVKQSDYSFTFILTPSDFFGLVNMKSNTASIFAIFIAALYIPR